MILSFRTLVGKPVQRPFGILCLNHVYSKSISTSGARRAQEDDSETKLESSIRRVFRERWAMISKRTSEPIRRLEEDDDVSPSALEEKNDREIREESLLRDALNEDMDQEVSEEDKQSRRDRHAEQIGANIAKLTWILETFSGPAEDIAAKRAKIARLKTELGRIKDKNQYHREIGSESSTQDAPYRDRRDTASAIDDSEVPGPKHQLQGSLSSRTERANPTFAKAKSLDFDSKSQFEDGHATGSQTKMTLTFPRMVVDSYNVAERSIPYIWLRDHCHCGECVNLETMQRSYDVFSTSGNIQPDNVELQIDGLSVKWNDGHQSFYKWSWLLKHLKLENIASWEHDKIQGDHFRPSGIPTRRFFDSSIGESPPSIEYEEVMSSDEGVARWMRLIHKHGFSYVDNCPISPEKTQELLERISFVRHTHYGGFYDFTSDLTMKDTAYTAEGLDAHTDTAYFTDPVGHQMFHLLSHTNGSGGKSLLVDGFRCASILCQEDPAAFLTLCKVSVPYHASGNEGISVRPRGNTSVFKSYATDLMGAPDIMRNVFCVRWNRYDRATYGSALSRRMILNSNENAAQIENWYRAARKWSEILKRPENEYWEQLKPGRPLIFDNHRVLHGRSAFTGNRRMCGGYLNRDDFISRLINLHSTREEILESI